MKIELEIPEGKRAEWVNGVLTLVEDKPKDITERIKTFEDACKWCNNHDLPYLVGQYELVREEFKTLTWTVKKDIIAYLKLRIITAALNEGWEPTIDVGRYSVIFGEGEGRIRSGMTNSHYCVSDSSFQLGFKSDNLAEYATEQFRDIYADFCGCKKGGEE